jgi:hypothetical protein
MIVNRLSVKLNYASVDLIIHHEISDFSFFVEGKYYLFIDLYMEMVLGGAQDLVFGNLYNLKFQDDNC